MSHVPFLPLVCIANNSRGVQRKREEGKREGEGKKEIEVLRKGRECKGEKEGKGKRKVKGNQVEKTQVGEGNQVSGNFTHPYSGVKKSVGHNGAEACGKFDPHT